jgi:DNA-binding winged helix-turn-helix (wHTH) protein
MDGFAHRCPTCGHGVTSDFLVSLDTNEVMVHGTRVRLTGDEAVVAHILARAYPARVSIDSLIRGLWSPINEPDDAMNNIKVKVSRLRRKIAGLGFGVGTFYGNGYRLFKEADGPGADEADSVDADFNGSGAMRTGSFLNRGGRVGRTHAQ